MKPNDADLRRYIRESAEYIEQRRRESRVFEKKPKEYEIIKASLDRAERHMHAMHKELCDIEKRMSYGEMLQFHEAHSYIQLARERALAAIGPLSDAKVLIRRDPATRAMREQKTALNLAHAFLEPPGKPSRATRAVARRIMVAAKIEEPSPEAMTKWLKEIRAEFDAHDRDARDRSSAEVAEVKRKRNGK